VTLSSIATVPVATPLKSPEKPAAIPGLALTSKDGPDATRWHEVKAATGRGYCIQSQTGSTGWSSSRGVSSRGAAEELDLVRLVEKDDKATYQLTRVHFDPPSGTLTATSRWAVELTEIARTPAGVVVWAYRDGKDVVVLARNVDGGVASRPPAGGDDAPFPFVSVDGCAFAATRLDGRKPESGAVAQLAGSLPARGTGKEKVVPRFIVDASLSRVTRDPEPRLAVRVRLQD
jgi:hypothetical protein